MGNNEYHEISLYQFEYKLIPSLIDAVKGQVTTISDFIFYMARVDWIINDILPEFKLKPNFDINELKANVSVIHDKNIIVTYTFPIPSEAPLAKFGAIVSNSKGNHYYTLEKAEYQDTQSWMLGSMSKNEHINLGSVDDCSTPEEFISLLDKKGLLVKYGFFGTLYHNFFDKK